jgi:excisionase family DNA binding protein
VTTPGQNSLFKRISISNYQSVLLQRDNRRAEKQENRMDKNILLLNVAEVSEILRISRAKVYLLLQEGTLHGFKLGADWRIKRESLEQLAGPIPDDFFNRKRRQKRAA